MTTGGERLQRNQLRGGFVRSRDCILVVILLAVVLVRAVLGGSREHAKQAWFHENPNRAAFVPGLKETAGAIKGNFQPELVYASPAAYQDPLVSVLMTERLYPIPYIPLPSRERRQQGALLVWLEEGEPPPHTEIVATYFSFRIYRIVAP